MPTPPLQELRMLSPIAWVQEERRRQEAKWGEQNHGILRYLGILGEERGEVDKVIEDVNYGKYASIDEYHRELAYELIQEAAVAVAIVEAIWRGGTTADTPYCPCGPCLNRGSLFPKGVVTSHVETQTSEVSKQTSETR